MISNCHKNIMGTLSFDGKFPGMRKAEEFDVYPMHDSGTKIRIQSDHRFGSIDLDTGVVLLSARKAQYATAAWLLVCVIRKTAATFTLAEEDRTTLRQWVKSTGGIEVGQSIVKTDNMGALAL